MTCCRVAPGSEGGEHACCRVAPGGEREMESRLFSISGGIVVVGISSCGAPPMGGGRAHGVVSIVLRDKLELQKEDRV